MGLIKPCCRFQMPPGDSGYAWDGASHPFEIFNGKGFEDVRSKMLAGEKVNGCETCYREERLGVQSMRQKVTGRKELSLGHEVQLEGLEIGFSRVCNLACISCNGHFSTAWEKFEVALWGQKPQYQKSDFKWSQLPKDQLMHLKNLKVTGGEPLLSPEFFKFIRRLVDESLAPGMEIEIFTNCTTKPKLSLLRDLEKFKRVEINLSIDSIREKNDYIRYQSDWSDLSDVAQVWRIASHGIPQLRIGFAITVSTMNILDIIDLYDWIYTHFNDVEIHNQILVDPVPLSIYKLPSASIHKIQSLYSLKKDAFLRKWDGCLRHSHLFEEIEHVLSETLTTGAESTHEKLVTYLDALDSVRKSNWRKTFPELNMVVMGEPSLTL